MFIVIYDFIFKFECKCCWVFVGIMGFFVFVGLFYVVYYVFVLFKCEEIDNVYVVGNLVMLLF